MSILDGVPALVATAVSDLFPEATLQYEGSAVSDGRGGFTKTKSVQTVKALVDDYTDFVRATQGIPRDERMVMVVGNGLAHKPTPSDIIIQGSEAWLVTEVSKDPANAVYTCRCKPTEVPSGIVPVLINAGASAIGNVLAGVDVAGATAINAPATAIGVVETGVLVQVDVDAPATDVAAAAAGALVSVPVDAGASAVGSAGAVPEVGVEISAAADAVGSVGNGLSVISGEASALFARMSSQPSAGRKAVINTTIEMMKAGANVWGELDCFRMFYASDFQQASLDWVDNCADMAIRSDGPDDTFTADSGIVNDNANNDGWDSGFEGSVDGVNWTNTAGHIGVEVVFTDSASTDSWLMGALSGGAIEIYKHNNNGGLNGVIAGRFGTASAYNSATTDVPSGHFVLSSQSGNAYMFIDGVEDAGTNPAVSNLDTPDDVHLGRGAGWAAQDTYRCFHAGGELTDTQAAELYAAIDYYLTNAPLNP